MWRSLAIFAVLTVLTGGNPAKEQNRSHLAQYEGSYYPLPTSAFFPRDEATAPDSQTTDNEPPHWYTVPEWWLCILGVPTLIFVGIQSYLMRVHARHFEDLARATSRDTEAMIAAERAWIVVSVESPVRNQFHFRATNVGRTPARVISIWSCPLIVKRGEELKLPSDSESGESLVNTPPCLLPPTASTIVFQISLADLYDPTLTGTFAAARQMLAKGFDSAYSFGRIIYTDVLATPESPSHETRWLYWHMPIDGSMPIPNPTDPKYNSYT
jgi:hypothetical protein